MIEEEWLTATEPRPMVRHIGPRAGERKRRLFAVASCRLVSDWFGERRSRHEIETGERMADGLPEDAVEAAELTAEDARMEHAVQEGMNPSWAHDGDMRLVRGVTRACVTDARESAEVVIAAFEWCDGVRYPFDAGVRTVGNSMPARQCRIVRDLFGNPFRPVTFFPSWRTETALALALQMYESRDFSAMPILADALQDAGCDNEDILNHCRDLHATHVRGCWVVDLVLGKE